MLWYLPGCDVNKNHLLEGKAMRLYMKETGADIAPCCRRDLDKLQDGDLVVENCTQCDFILKERRPGLKVVSLYELYDSLLFLQYQNKYHIINLYI